MAFEKASPAGGSLQAPRVTILTVSSLGGGCVLWGLLQGQVLGSVVCGVVASQSLKGLWRPGMPAWHLTRSSADPTLHGPRRPWCSWPLGQVPLIRVCLTTCTLMTPRMREISPPGRWFSANPDACVLLCGRSGLTGRTSSQQPRRGGDHQQASEEVDGPGLGLPLLLASGTQACQGGATIPRRPRRGGAWTSRLRGRRSS